MTMVARMRSLRELNVWDSGVTDAGVKALATLPHLETLYLDGTEITDEALKHLKSTNTLRTLWITRTLVSAEAVRELQHALPKCTIHGPEKPCGAALE